MKDVFAGFYPQSEYKNKVLEKMIDEGSEEITPPEPAAWLKVLSNSRATAASSHIPIIARPAVFLAMSIRQSARPNSRTVETACRSTLRDPTILPSGNIKSSAR